MEKLFGTDGIRGIFEDEINADLVFRVGVSLYTYFGDGTYIIARDTRKSGVVLVEALYNSLKNLGCNVINAGIISTPCAAYLTKKLKSRCAIVITASHNPPNYNGIKVFDGNGYKLCDSIEQKIEKLIRSYDNNCAITKNTIKTNEKSKCYTNNTSAISSRSCFLKDANIYKNYVDDIIDKIKFDFSNIRVCVDCGNGAISNIIKHLFSKLKINAFYINDKFDGDKINQNCGALYPEAVLQLCKEKFVDIGLSFDGDADRLSVSYRNKVIDGNILMYNLSKILKANVVVSTILANIALENKLKEDQKILLRSKVGDKYVSEIMKEGNYSFGGEPSGHFIIDQFSNTGDGLIASLFLMKCLIEYGNIENFELMPQKMISIECKREVLSDEKLLSLIKTKNKTMKENERMLIRYSGTEPKLRVMVESSDEKKIDETLCDIEQLIKSIK